MDREPPVAGPGEVQVSMLEAGVCGTDFDIVRGRYGNPPAGSVELILGHENLGEVSQVGVGVRGVEVGDVVVATVRRGCGICRFCRTNRSDFCETGLYTERGIRGRDGYFTDSYVDIPDYLVVVPRALVGVAVLLEPLSVVEKAVLEGQRVLDRKEPTPGAARTSIPSALVAGTGAIGLLAAFVLRMRGYEVTAVDRHDDTTPNAAILAGIGARHVNVAPGLSALEDFRFDLILEATGSVDLDFELMKRLGPNGVLVLTGIPDAGAPPAMVPGGQLLREIVLENQAVVGSVNANRSYFEVGLHDLDSFERAWPGGVGRLITARRPVEEYSEVFLGRTPGSIKTVLSFPRGTPAADEA